MKQSAKVGTGQAKKGPQSAPPRPGLDAPHFVLRHGGVEYLVLGTAHVSQQSVKDVESQVAAFKPDVICVELCEPRLEALRDKDRWRKLDLAKVIKEKKLGLLLSSLILSSFQKKIGETSGAKPGAEMARAIELAERKSIPYVLADREVRATLLRAFRQVGFFSKIWLASVLLSSLLVRDEIDAAEIERLKQEDVLADLFDNLPARYGQVKTVIIDERDAYLAEKIRRAGEELSSASGRKTRRVMAVVGAGHLEGIRRHLEAENRADLHELAIIPKARRVRTIISWVFVGVIGLGVSWWLQRNPQDLWDLLIFWVACRSLGSGIGAMLGGAHMYSVLATMAAAPFSIFLLGTRLWMLTALVELSRRKPRVEDFENIASDTDTLGGLWRSLYSNRVLHLIWIIFMTGLGLTAGNLIFLSEFVRGVLRSQGWI